MACTGLAWDGHNLWADAPATSGGFLLATAFLFPVLWHFARRTLRDRARERPRVPGVNRPER